jgi:hypothetical protein
MSAEIINVAALTAKSASYVQRLKDLATAHPVGAVIAGTAVATVAVVGGYKLASKLFGSKKAEVPVVQVNVTSDAPVGPDVKATIV